MISNEKRNDIRHYHRHQHCQHRYQQQQQQQQRPGLSDHGGMK